MPGNIKHTVGSGMGGFRGDQHQGLEEDYSRKMTKGMIGTDAVTYEGSYDHYTRPIIPIWEDRNTDNIGSKLNGSKKIKGNLKQRPDKNIIKKARKKSNG